MVISDFSKDISTPSKLGNTVEAQIDTKYKTIEKKVKPVTTPLPARSFDDI